MEFMFHAAHAPMKPVYTYQSRGLRYAVDLATRLAKFDPREVLETAAGTGVLNISKLLNIV